MKRRVLTHERELVEALRDFDVLYQHLSRVEAEDRALETARILFGGDEDRKIYVYGGLPEFFGNNAGWATCKQIAALIQSAMNAQERETLREIRDVACGEKQVADDDTEALAWIFKRAERLLAEREEGR